MVSLISEGYGGYPRWFTNVLGWGVVAALPIAAAVITGLRWRHDVDEFVPDTIPGAAATGPRTETRR